MYENIDDNGRIVICRKNYCCEWCGETIHKGEKAVVRVYKFDGDFNSAHQHPECFEALRHSIEDMFDGSFDGYGQKRGCTINGESISECSTNPLS